MNTRQPEFELEGRAAGSATAAFHGDLRETQEMLSPSLPAPPQCASSRPRTKCITPSAESVTIGWAATRIVRQAAASSIQSGSS
jgi:hypothetical protein